ncbi:MAG: anthranilate phosphoribosyltransferase [Nitrospinaceae bacterium]|nr:anthranilate phosphoribosyltransferase [Nitrospinaceae bacterium]NIR56948.1 anthranilate phosphoribosyltransferase [Nitrospinaceae bacterium]NIS87404.1 anthranilate phosphoribosyltransferase [Nitrospinaceae bacterium]NIT84256.1 anthranilate phosphoribosyltransferase [Nitrospinaceae bacterium]NIU46444.1 anthranilate phosphoribosyltransferase [Nitrospinaceae bacterium]
MTDADILRSLHKVVDGQDLTEEEMMSVMHQVMDGRIGETPMAAFLTALHMKGESVPEIVGAARVMREKADSLQVCAEPIVDTCGTGGDGADTFNISTAAAFVVAGAGVTVAKHGNRAISSRSGSADVLKHLGVNIEADKGIVERCLEQVGIGFLFAPRLHGAMKFAAGVRRELGFRTIFNLLGPLTNPAHAHAQVIGVFDRKWVEPLAQVVHQIGILNAFVVHGEDGLDEITLTDRSYVSELHEGKIHQYFLEPEEFGLNRCRAEELKGGEPGDNAAIIRDILERKPGPKADIVVLNAAAALKAAGKVHTLRAGVELARQAIASGAAWTKLDELIRVSHS